MSQIFDAILVGAGPCGVAGLTALDRGARLAVVTGEKPENHRGKDIHPKIRAIALDRNEKPGIADRLERAVENGKPLFSAATSGGLANYWGQLFCRYGSCDPYPSGIFENYESYLEDSRFIERMFSLTGGNALPRPAALPGDYQLFQPRLLRGTAEDSAADLMSMRRALEVASSGVAVFSQRALNISQKDQLLWSVNLSDGSSIAAKKIWLAAGVLGTLRIVTASLDDIAGASIRDHSPYMVYVTGLRKVLTARSNYHFNALTLEKEVAGRCTVFASIYDMSASHLNLILASTIGQGFRILKSIPAPFFASLVQPVQIWTDHTFSRVEIDAGKGRFTGSELYPPPDNVLNEIFGSLRLIGARIWHYTRTAPGLGFHYHSTSVRRKNGTEQALADLLAHWSGGAVSCIDPSVFPEIGLRPHTLTAMAAARRIVLSEAHRLPGG
jgi:hypothetical protein